MKHFITLDDFTLEEILQIVADSIGYIPFAWEKRFLPKKDRLYVNFKDKMALKLIMMLEPTSRTGYSNWLGGKLNRFEVMMLAGKEALSLAKSESLADAVRTHAGTQRADILVLRTKFEGSARFAKEILAKSGYQCAVHNAGDGANRHPTQALLNLTTIMHKLGRLNDFTIGFFGDLKYSRTLNSDLDALRILNNEYRNIRVITVCAPGTGIPDYRRQGLEIEEYDSFDAFRQCDVISGIRIQQERYTDPMEKARVMGKFILGLKILNSMKDDVVVMHPGPRGPEIDAAISLDPRVVMWEQMFIGVATRMALDRWSYNLLDEKTTFDDIKPCRIEEKEKEPNEDRLKKREKEGKTDEYFRPIRRRGTIIDHITLGLGGPIKRIMKKFNGAEGQGTVHSVEIEGRKDVIVLQGKFPKPWFKTIIEFLNPNTTFNIIDEGWFEKQKVRISGATMPNALTCPNPVCISRNEEEAESSFTVCLRTSKAMCDNCMREFTRAEIIKATFDINVEQLEQANGE